MHSTLGLLACNVFFWLMGKVKLYATFLVGIEIISLRMRTKKYKIKMLECKDACHCAVYKSQI